MYWQGVNGRAKPGQCSKMGCPRSDIRPPSEFETAYLGKSDITHTKNVSEFLNGAAKQSAAVRAPERGHICFAQCGAIAGEVSRVAGPSWQVSLRCCSAGQQPAQYWVNSGCRAATGQRRHSGALAQSKPHQCLSLPTAQAIPSSRGTGSCERNRCAMPAIAAPATTTVSAPAWTSRAEASMTAASCPPGADSSPCSPARPFQS